MRGGRGVGRGEAAVVLVGIAVVLVVGGLNARGSSSFSRNVSRAAIAHDMKLHVSLSHLWLEEALAGDRGVDVYRDVLGNLAEAQEQCRRMVVGGRSHLGRAAPAGSARGDTRLELCRRIDEFRANSINRIALGASTGSGTLTDQSNDVAFKELLAAADAYIDELTADIQDERQDLDRLEMVTIIVLAVLFGVVAVLVRRSRRAVEAAASETTLRREDEVPGHHRPELRRHHHQHVARRLRPLVELRRRGNVRVHGRGDDGAARPTPRRARRHGGPTGDPPAGARRAPRKELRGHPHMQGRDLAAVSLTVSPIHHKGKGMVAMSAILRDTTDSKALEAALEHRAFYDELTGLPNRSLLQDRLVHGMERAARTGLPPAVILLDLDNFKAIK